MSKDKEEFDRWMAQAEYTFNSAKNDFRGKYFSWCCFKCQQSAEFALKALSYGIGEVSFGHSLLKLKTQLQEEFSVDCHSITDRCLFLDKFYIPTRYPDSYPAGSPKDYYTAQDAKTALESAEEILHFVKEVFDEIN